MNDGGEFINFCLRKNFRTTTSFGYLLRCMTRCTGLSLKTPTLNDEELNPAVCFLFSFFTSELTIASSVGQCFNIYPLKAVVVVSGVKLETWNQFHLVLTCTGIDAGVDTSFSLRWKFDCFWRFFGLAFFLSCFVFWSFSVEMFFKFWSSLDKVFSTAVWNLDKELIKACSPSCWSLPCSERKITILKVSLTSFGFLNDSLRQWRHTNSLSYSNHPRIVESIWSVSPSCQF